MYCSVSIDTDELRAKVIQNSNFLFQLPLRITEALHSFRELEEALVLNNKREILLHATHYLPTSTPTVLLTREGVPYVPNFTLLPRGTRIEDNFFTISFVLGEGKNFQYVGIFDTVMEFESDNDKYRLDLDLGRNMEASVTSASGKLYEFGIEKMVMHTGSLRHEIENNAKAIHQLFMLYD
jgi:hypothetical protein